MMQSRVWKTARSVMQKEQVYNRMNELDDALRVRELDNGAEMIVGWEDPVIEKRKERARQKAEKEQQRAEKKRIKKREMARKIAEKFAEEV